MASGPQRKKLKQSSILTFGGNKNSARVAGQHAEAVRENILATATTDNR